MPTRSVIPETALATVRRYCQGKVPVRYQNELRVEWAVRGKAITIHECRPPWRPDQSPDWTRRPVAQLRYDPADHHWRLFYADRNSRWHPYDRVEPTPRLDDLLAELEEDATGIFWG